MSANTAAGPMSGYLFQHERALFWLACSDQKSIVGIETIDDVVVQAGNGTSIYEQDKHSIAKHGKPFTDNSNDLWKTLSIWLSAVKNEEIDINKAQFHLVTNKLLDDDALAIRLGQAEDAPNVNACIEELRQVGAKAPASSKRYVDQVLLYTNSELAALIHKIRCYDGRQNTFGAELKNQVVSHLHLPEGLPFEQIIQALIGWIHDFVLESWRAGDPAWIKRSSFDNQLFRILANLRTQRFTETAKNLFPVSEEDRRNNMRSTFVEQLLLLELDDEDELIECIDDYIRCVAERTRLSRNGWVTKQDIISFDERLRERWRTIFRRTKALAGVSPNLQTVGYDILQTTLNHREQLAGQETEENYLTRGAYHKLADVPLLGWHPEYQKLLSLKKGSK